jgi:hypothetical protein
MTQYINIKKWHKNKQKKDDHNNSSFCCYVFVYISFFIKSVLFGVAGPFGTFVDPKNVNFDKNWTLVR